MTKREITFAEAIGEAIKEELRRDERVFYMGEDIKYNVWGIARGIQNEFGERIMHLPISENGFCSAAVGAALTGMRPIVELMYADFLLVAMDAIGNQASRYRYMCGGGDFKVPATYRAAGTGAGSGSGMHHNQYPEALMLHFPGLKVVAASTPYDAKGLLKTAIRDDNPVVFFEYKILYTTRGHVPEEEYLIPLGQAKTVREGSDVTVVSFANGVHKALAASEQLAQEGINPEVIDLRTLRPLDKEAIIQSVQKTSKLVIVEDGCKTMGVAAEIAALVSEEALEYLDSPIKRVAGADTSIPAGRHAELVVIPSVEAIAAGIKDIL